MRWAPELRPIDLYKCTKGSGGLFSDHPDIDSRKTYLARIYGKYHLGPFSRQWYGWNFINWGTSGIQLDKPGTNASWWEGLWELVERDQEPPRITRKVDRLLHLNGDGTAYYLLECGHVESLAGHYFHPMSMTDEEAALLAPHGITKKSGPIPWPASVFLAQPDGLDSPCVQCAKTPVPPAADVAIIEHCLANGGHQWIREPGSCWEATCSRCGVSGQGG